VRGDDEFWQQEYAELTADITDGVQRSLLQVGGFAGQKKLHVAHFLVFWKVVWVYRILQKQVIDVITLMQELQVFLSGSRDIHPFPVL